MVNPKDFSPTDFGYKKPVDKSGSSRTSWDAPTPNGEREWSGPTPYSHNKPIPRSSKANLGMPYPMSSDRSEMAPGGDPGMKPATKKSKPGVPSDPVKWHKQGRYNMVAPASEKEAMPITNKMKAK